MFDTLLADQDGVYNSKVTNDPPVKLAGESRLPLPRVRDRVRNGWVHGRQTRHQKSWIARADAGDLTGSGGQRPSRRTVVAVTRRS